VLWWQVNAVRRPIVESAIRRPASAPLDAAHRPVWAGSRRACRGGMQPALAMGRGSRKWLGRPPPSVFNNGWGTRKVLTDFQKHGEHDLAGRDGIANLRNPPTPSAHRAPRR
jgi:hypothetical protein